jgi:hypothetical protein
MKRVQFTGGQCLPLRHKLIHSLGFIEWPHEMVQCYSIYDPVFLLTDPVYRGDKLEERRGIGREAGYAHRYNSPTYISHWI